MNVAKLTSDSIEEKLNKFRREKSKQEVESPGLLGWVRRRIGYKKRASVDDSAREKMEHAVLLEREQLSDSNSQEEDDCQLEIVSDEEYEKTPPRSALSYGILAIISAIYILGQVLAVLVGFGAVFFSVSLLLFICTNLRTRKRRRNELSAYSVFNPGCRPIQGSLSAEQLEGQLKYGMLHF